MRLGQQALTVLGIVAAALAAVSCSGSTEPCHDALKLRITGSDGARPAEFVAAVTLGEAATQVVECGGEVEATEALTCTDEGLEIGGFWSENEIVIKARGYEFLVTHVMVPTESTEDCRVSTTDLPLTPLDPAVQNDDYATGFGADDVELFKELAYYTATELGPTWALKFYMRNINDQPEVYFQNSVKYGLHYTFAQKVLHYTGSATQFGKETYYGLDRISFAGTILYRPDIVPNVATFGGPMPRTFCLTFFPSDGLQPEQVLTAHRLLEERIGFAPLTGPDDRFIYGPAGSTQEGEAAAAAADFRMKDVLWVTRTELYKDIKLQLLNPGKAYGTLRVMSPEELDKAVVSFNDILVLTRLPNSLPIVGGTITEELQTPLAHVNLMAQSRGTPNIALLGASLDPRIAPFVDKLVKFEVGKEGFSISETTLAEAQKYWDSLKKDPFFPEHDDEVEGLPTFAEFGFADSRAFGVKAANLAEMTHIIPDSTPDGFGVPFHYYDQFMATAKATPALCEKAREDCVKEGRSEEICGQALGVCKKHAGEGAVFWDYVTALLADKDFKGETLLREACLDNLVWMIRNSEVDPEFGAMLDARVAELMGDHKIRLRSSTNSEDLPHFSGAGLYVSVSAVAAGEKAASKRILEVWASIWKWKPFEERAFWNIDHLSVRMGICASRSFPDEQANGVLITQNIADPFSFGYYVNVQLGEISVTNPEDGSTPEAFSILPKPGGGIQIARLYFSSLSPDKAILADGEVTALYDTCRKVQKHFAKLYDQDPYYFALDVEFKFEGPERKLYLKQVRPYAPKSEL